MLAFLGSVVGMFLLSLDAIDISVLFHCCLHLAYRRTDSIAFGPRTSNWKRKKKRERERGGEGEKLCYEKFEKAVKPNGLCYVGPYHEATKRN